MATFDDLELPNDLDPQAGTSKGPPDPGPMDQAARNLVLASILMITVAVAGVGMYRYERFDVAQRMNAYGARLQAEQNATKALTNAEITSLKRGTAAYGDLLKRLKTNLPDTNEVPSLIDSLQRIARAHQVSVMKIRPQGKQLDSLFTTHPVQVVLSGRFLDVTEAVSELSRMPRLFIPIRMTVEPKTKGLTGGKTAKDVAVNGLVDADIMFNTYTIPTAAEKATLAATTGAAAKGTRKRGKEPTP
jgi:Tfp pilus assembly protein PilO